MFNIPFFFPENDINLRLTRLLIIMSVLSFTKRGNPALTIGKLALFEFLIRYPQILICILNDYKDEVDFQIIASEFGSIESQYPEISTLIECEEIRLILQVLLLYEFVEPIKTPKEVFYKISQSGLMFVKEFESDYLIRINEIAVASLPLLSESESKLRNIIKLNIRGA